MIIFNAFQLVLLFACGPFLIEYVHGASFYAHQTLFWVFIVAYLIGFGCVCASVASSLDRN